MTLTEALSVFIVMCVLMDAAQIFVVFYEIQKIILIPGGRQDSSEGSCLPVPGLGRESGLQEAQ